MLMSALRAAVLLTLLVFGAAACVEAPNPGKGPENTTQETRPASTEQQKAALPASAPSKPAPALPTIEPTQVPSAPNPTAAIPAPTSQAPTAPAVIVASTPVRTGPGQALVEQAPTPGAEPRSAGGAPEPTPEVASGGSEIPDPAYIGVNSNPTAQPTASAPSSGGTVASPTLAPVVTAIPVRSAPSFLKGADQQIPMNAGPQAVPNWATGIRPFQSGTQGSTLRFVVTRNSNPYLFAAGPRIDPVTGTLTYAAYDNLSNSATITVRLQYDGADGAVISSEEQSFAITVGVIKYDDDRVPTRRAPSFTIALTPPAVDEDSPSQTIAGFATGMSAADGEPGRTLTFITSNDNSSLFTTQPAISSSGVLTYAPAPNAFGSAMVSAVLKDDGGTANGRTDTSSPRTFLLTVNPVNDGPAITVPGAQVVNEDTALTVNGVSAADPDAGSRDLKVTMTAGNGLLSLSSFMGLMFITGDGIADSTLVFRGTQPSVNAALSGFSYSGTLNYSGTDTISIEVDDLGNIGSGGALTASRSISVTVRPVNDAPSFTKGANQTVNEDAAAQVVTSWATGMSAGPANESGQTISFTITNDNNGLFTIQPTVSAGGTLTYTTAPNAYGVANVSVTLGDDGGTANGGADSSTQAFTITINPVNDMPSFTKGADQTVNEDAGAQSVSNWATSISAGPANETGQTLSFVVTNDNNPLFSAQPAISASGNLAYTAAPDVSGSATITVSLTDSGGTADGGVDTSAARTFTITVRPVNDAPYFAKGSDQTVSEDAGPQSVSNWATGISAGPADEAGQTLSFVVTNDNSGLFSTQPAISTAGTLTYTPAANASGSATISVTLADDGGTANGGVDRSATRTSIITVTAVNDAPAITVPGAQTAAEDTSITVTGTTVNDPDAGSGSLSVSVSAPNGAISLASTSGLTFSTGDGTADSSMSFTGSLTSMNTALSNLGYRANTNYNGSDTITITVNDQGNAGSGGAKADSKSIDVTITAVNDAPSFTKGADQMVLEDAGAQAVANWASAISAGPANEAAQTLSFSVTNGNNSLFSVQPGVSTSGTLTYTPAANASGTATVTVRLEDSGGTASGGVDYLERQFTITVSPVNDIPSFTKGADQTVLEDAGAQSVPGWAAGISAGPANEAGQTLAFDITDNTNPSLFAVAPAVSTAGVLTYTPAANASGSATITVRLRDNGGTANGGVDTSPAQSFTITVSAVNDAPSFTKGANQAVDEDSGAQAVPSWATGMSAGPADEAGQTLSFTVTNDNGSLFSDQPAVSPAGTLAYTPAANAFGVANVSVTLTDNGGTADGGVDSSTLSFTITVRAINDAPSFSKGADQTVNEDAGAQTVTTWATGISAGPANEASQTLSFVVTANTNAALFSAGPAISPDGTLTYTSAANKNGSATITVKAQDNGGTANGGIDSSATTDFTITVAPVNDKPTAQAKSYTAQANMRISVAAGSGLLVGGSDSADASDAGYTPALTVGAVSATSPAGGAVTADTATGSFTFDPPPGVTGDVTFTYTVCDTGNPAPSACSDPATVTVTVSGPVIWFVDASAAPGGQGRLSDPFNNMAAAGTAIGTSPNHRVFLSAGTYSSGLTLNSGGWLIGQGVSGASFDAVMGITPPSSTPVRPTIGSGAVTVQGAVSLASNAVVKALAIAPTGSTGGLAGTDATSVTVESVSVATQAGTAISFNNVSGTVSLSSASANGAATGISLTNVSALLTIGGGSLTTTGTGLLVDGGTSNVTYPGNIVNSGSGNSVLVRNRASSAVVVSGNITDTGQGILVQNNAGSTVTFTGTKTLNTGSNASVTLTNNPGAMITFSGGNLSITTVSGKGFSATGGGTVTVQGGPNTIATQTGTALEIQNTTIGGAGLTFRSISANGSPNGILLNNTGASGSLAVTGDGGGSNNGSGGTIQNTTGPGVSLTSTRNVSLSYMNVTSARDDGITGASVSGLTLTRSNLTNSGDSDSGEDGIDITDLSGTANLTGVVIQGSRDAHMRILNNSGNLTLNVTNSTLSSNSTTGSMGDGIYLESRSGANVTLSVTNSTFTNSRGDHIDARTVGSGNLDVTITGNTMTGDRGTTYGGTNLGSGVLVLLGDNGTGRVTFDVSNNSITGSVQGSAIGVSATGFTGSSGQLSGTINNNTIGQLGVADSGSAQGSGIYVGVSGRAKVTATVSNNRIYQYNNYGIYMYAGDSGNQGQGLDVTLTGNTIASPGTFATNGIHLNNGTTSAAAIDGTPDTFTSRVDIRNNNVADGGKGTADIRLRQRKFTTVSLPGYSGSATDLTAVANFVAANNSTGGPTVTANADALTVPSGGGFVGGS